MTDIINPPASESEQATGTAWVKGRSVAVKQLTGTQLVIADKLTRIAERAERQAAKAPEGSPERLELWRETLKATGQMMDILGSMVVDPDDLEWLEAEMLAGRLELTELTPMLEAVLPQGDTSVKPRSKAKAIRR